MANQIPTAAPGFAAFSTFVWPFAEELPMTVIAVFLLVASLARLLFGSLRWSLVALMAALLLLSPVLLLVGGGALHLNNSQ